MKSITEYILESIFDKNLVKKDIKYHPKTKQELIDCIKEQLEIQGPDANLNIIDVSKITDMSDLFSSINSKTGLDVQNIDISEWDVSRVKNMKNMFYDCRLFNSDLSKWDVSNVEDMFGMFQNCQSFNSDLSKWDVGKVKRTAIMFYNCHTFNSNLSKWNVSNIHDMRDMFGVCLSLKKTPRWYK